MAVSAHAIVEAYKQHSDKAWRILLTIEHPSFVMTIRVVNSREDVVSRGQTFLAFPFDIILPDQDPDSVPKAQLRIENVSREIYQEIWALPSAPKVKIEAVLSDTPDVVEYEASDLYLERTTVDERYITGDLVAARIEREPYPGNSFSPQDFPGLH